GHGREWLPVRNPAPIRLDVVLNFANWLDPELRQSPSATLYRRRIGRLLQIGSVLSHLGLVNGCVRVSGMDVNTARKVFDRADANTFNWEKTQQSVSIADQELMDVSTLQHRTETALAFRRFLSDVLYNSGGC